MVFLNITRAKRKKNRTVVIAIFKNYSQAYIPTLLEVLTENYHVVVHMFTLCTMSGTINC